MRRAFLSAGVVSALSTATGCGGVIAFSDQQPIRVAVANAKPEPQENKRVELKFDRIEINEKVQFEIDEATIRPESFDLLNEVVEVLEKNPGVKKVKVVGHTDNDGDPAYNQQLSERRAASVRTYLTKHGVSGERLESEGRGESDPLVSNDTFKGREQNRRVEFRILEQDTTKEVSAEIAAKESAQ